MRPYLQYAIAIFGAVGLAAVSLSAVDPELGDAVLAGAGSVATDAESALQARASAPPNAFYFTRGIYTSYGRGWGRGGRNWAIDFPKADLQFLVVLRRLTNLDAYDSEHAVALHDPELRRYPFVYMLEVGDMSLTQPEIDGLRDYMLKGGFVFIDDFWGANEWRTFEQQMQRVLPEYPIVDMPSDHPLLSSFYDIDEILQIPSINTVRSSRGTTECGGCEVTVRAIFDDRGRLMMLINWNTDLGDAWEWAEQPDYPTRYSTFAYQMGVNAIVYAMSH